MHPAPIARPVEPVSFARFTPGPMGPSFSVLTPERIPRRGTADHRGGANPTHAPIMLDTGMMGPPQLGFNNAPVYLYTVPMRKTLAPGEGCTWQCTAKLPTTQAGQLSFTLGQITIAGPVAEG